MGWAHARNERLRVHAVQPLIEVDAGAAVGSRVWLGGGLGIGATGAWAFDASRASAWAFRVHVPAIVEVAISGPWFARAEAGLDLQTPALNFRGDEHSLRWGLVRPFLGLGFGLRLG